MKFRTNTITHNGPIEIGQIRLMKWNRYRFDYVVKVKILNTYGIRCKILQIIKNDGFNKFSHEIGAEKDFITEVFDI